MITRRAFIIVGCLVVLTAGVLTHRSEVVKEALWVLGFWLVLSAAFGIVAAAAGYRMNTLRARAVDRQLRETQRVFTAKVNALIAQQAATPHQACICPSTAAGLDLCDRCPGRNP